MKMVLPDGRLGSYRWPLRRTYVFGVLNVTPDSFSDGGDFADTASAVARGRALAAAGADAIDVGGESTRPGARPVPLQQELDRVLPVLEALAAELEIPLSVDTYKASVARQAVAAGASIVNDISGLALDSEMVAAVAETDAALILGHLRGAPATMQENIHFQETVAEVAEELRERVQRAVAAGIDANRIWIDPGIGFGKTARQSIELLAATGELRAAIGQPIMVGPSRKSFIGELTGAAPSERLMGTAAAVSIAVALGADAVRIHDVAELQQAVKVASAIRDAARWQAP